jgi:hypothetical protein
MERNDMLIGRGRAKYLSAVSGGSYIATAFAMVATGRIEAAAEQGDPSIDPDKEPPKDGHPDMRPFARGTPEERYLRGHTLYLTHGRGGVPGAIWRVLVGLMFNLTLVGLTIAALAIPLGWFYGWAWPSLQAGCPGHCPSTEPFAVPSGLWWAVIATAIAATVSGYVWLAVRFRTRWVRTVWGTVSGTLAVGALALLLFGIGIPELIALARPHTTAQAVPASAQTVKSTTVAATSVGLFALFVSWVVVVRKVVATPTSLEKGVVKALRGFTARHRSFLIDMVAFLAGPVLVLALVVVFAYVGSAHPPGWSDGGHRWELLLWAGCVVALVALWWWVDVTQSSLYPIYRRYLSSAFVIGRTHRSDATIPSPTAVGEQDAEPRPYSISYRLSDCASEDFPEILICASANISDYGQTPSGSNVTSFVFSPSWVGGPLIGAVPTSEYEKCTGGGATAQSWFTTLPTAMAISGAAISPSMGKMTRPAFRFFMAVANLRLGVWVPNPRRLAKFEGRRRRHQILARPHYLVREMLGRNHLDAPYLYVTDGGHYENLGLVELLRRKCKTIWCIDASGDQIDTFDTFGGALLTAFSELGVSIDIDPNGDMAPPRPPEGSLPAPLYVKAPYCKGTITYADGKKGSIVLVKAGVPEDAPWNIRAYLAQHPHFPCDPTLDQLYDGDRFDAYRALGEFSVQAAITAFGVDQQKSPAESGPNDSGPARSSSAMIE